MTAELERTEEPLNNYLGWQEKYLQPIVISLLILALFSGLTTLFANIVPDGPWRFLPWLILLVSAESILTTRWLATTDRPVNRLAYRTAELTVIFLFLRLFTWLFITGLPVADEIEGLLIEPSLILDPVFLTFSFLLFFVWQQTSFLMGIFIKLQLDDDELYYYSKEGAERNKLSRPQLKNRRALLEDFYTQWIIGGLILGTLATLSTFNLSGLTNDGFQLRTISRLGLQPAMLAALLVYFIGGLWLAGQGQLATLRSRWLLQDIEPDPAMSRTWHRSSLILIGIIATIAAFLPIGSTFAISRILQLISLAIIVVVNLIFALLASILFFIGSIFFRPSEEAVAEPLDFTEIVPEQFILPPPPEQAPSPLIGGIFWVIVIVAVIAAVIFFLRGRGVPITSSAITKLFSTSWQRFRTWLISIWQGVGKQVQQIEQTIRERLQIADKTAAGQLSWGRPPFRSLSPRQKIRYYYLSILRRAEDRGIERGTSETPSEFVADLVEEWPEADDEVEAITDAFLKARYSPQPITGDDIGPVKETWNRIKTAIRKRRS